MQTEIGLGTGWINRWKHPALVEFIRSRNLFLAAQWLVAAAVSFVIVVVLAVIVILAFTTGFPSDISLTLDNVHSVMGSSSAVLVNTIIYAVLSIVVCLVFSIPLAVLVERTDLPSKAWIVTALTVSVLVPSFIKAMGWVFMASPNVGIFNSLLRAVFGTDFGITVYSIPAMAFIEGLSLVPIMFLMIAPSIRALSSDYVEAGTMSGASNLQVFRRITLPQLTPALMAGAIYVFAIALGSFDVPGVIGMAKGIQTLPTATYLAMNPNTGLPNYGLASSYGLVLVVLGGVASIGYFRLLDRGHQFAVITGKGYRQVPHRLGMAGKAGAVTFIGIYFALAIIIPLFILFWASVMPYFQPPSIEALQSISFENYSKALDPYSLLLPLKNTLITVLVAPTLTLLVAICFSYLIVRAKVRHAKLFDLVAFLPHLVPNIIFAAGMMMLALYMPWLGLYGTLALIILTQSISSLSFATRNLNNSMLQVHKDMEECAQMCGASTKQALWRVLLPLVKPALINTWIWMFLLKYRELTIALALLTQENQMLSTYVYGTWSAGSVGKAAALSMILFVVMTPIMGFIWYLGRRMQR